MAASWRNTKRPLAPVKQRLPSAQRADSLRPQSHFYARSTTKRLSTPETLDLAEFAPNSYTVDHSNTELVAMEEHQPEIPPTGKNNALPARTPISPRSPQWPPDSPTCPGLTPSRREETEEQEKEVTMDSLNSPGTEDFISPGSPYPPQAEFRYSWASRFPIDCEQQPALKRGREDSLDDEVVVELVPSGQARSGGHPSKKRREDDGDALLAPDSAYYPLDSTALLRPPTYSPLGTNPGLDSPAAPAS